MIEELKLSSFGLISAELLFSPGFNVIIGETGAGKSLLLSSIDFLKGGKSTVVSEGSFVEAVFKVGKEELFVRREIKGNRSRYFMNGMRIPQRLIENRVSSLVSFQSQRQSIELLKTSHQQELLDHFSEVSLLLEEYQKLYRVYRQSEERIKELISKATARNREIDILRFQIEEIENANVQPDEEERLHRLKEIVSNLEKIRNFKNFARVYLYDGNSSVLERLRVVIKELERLKMGKEILEKLNSIYYEVEEVFTDIESSFEIQEEEVSLESIENRLYEIEKIKRKYGNSYDEIQNFLKKSKERLNFLENFDFEVEKIQKEQDAVRNKLKSLAIEISASRKKGAEKLENYLTSSFSQLNMTSARFKVNLERLTDFSPKGIDSVQFLFSGNPKLPLSPISKSISGGELSRFLLSVLSFLGTHETTMVFDEVDAGMSGKVLMRVAEKLKDISEKQQVIAVTHSPQIAAAADKTFKVEKNKSGEITIRVLTGKEKEEEIAIMIAGKANTTAINAARDLLNRWKK